VKPLRVLGVDPGLRTTGYGAIALDGGVRPRLIEAGIVTARERDPLEMRLGQLHRGMRGVLAATAPDVVVVEELWSAYDHPATAVLMGHARGVLYLAAGECGVPVRSLAHARVKRVLTGSGAAKKAQVKFGVMRMLNIADPPQPDDVSDALALALAFAHVDAADRRLAAHGIAPRTEVG